MATAHIRSESLYAWKGSSLLIVTPRGECGEAQPLTGFYCREARFLRTLRLTIDGVAPWLCEAAQIDPACLTFSYAYPEIDERGLPQRAFAIYIVYTVRPQGLTAVVTIANHSGCELSVDAAVSVDADFIDIQDAIYSTEIAPRARIDRAVDGKRLTLSHRHDTLPYETEIRHLGDPAWTWTTTGLESQLRLAPQQESRLTLDLDAVGPAGRSKPGEDTAREAHLARWRDGFTHVLVPGNRVAEDVIIRNIRDVASFPLLEGPMDEWLTLQAGMPSYPALFGRDTITAGWQAAFLDRAESLDASLTTLGRLQGTRVDDWRDEEPGRIPYQVRRGPQAILNLNPYAAYYADYASPLMFVIALAHLYSWTGEKKTLERHWDTARRILEWARTYGDADRDGYLEYLTRSSQGTKNQGWKDSGDAIVYDDGTPVPPPIATCEIQGYWFAAQQLMAPLSVVMGAAGDARAHWQSAMDLKKRFNRDWWVAEEGCVALAMDPDKRLVRAVTSNAGHCVAAGIISDEHLPAVVGRLFAPDMFSGWGVRTLSASHAAYNPLSYHCGTVWAVEQATIALGLRRFGFDARAADLVSALFDLAALYPEFRIPECVGGWPRGERPTPGAYPRANTPQLWNASAFPLVVHTLLGLQPVAALSLLVVDPVLPHWLPEVVLEGVRLGDATATLRFWRDGDGASHAEVVRKQGTLRLVHQPPLESLTAGIRDRMSALVDTVMH